MYDSGSGVDQQLEIVDEAQNRAAILGSKITRGHCGEPGTGIGLDQTTELLQRLFAGRAASKGRYPIARVGRLAADTVGTVRTGGEALR